MPTTGNQIKFLHGTQAQYTALSNKADDTIYFLTDTRQLYVGETEYTEAAIELSAQPVSGTTSGVPGRLYVYNGNMYMVDASKNWTKVANVNEKQGTVTGVTAGSGLTGGTIATSGTIAHAVPAAVAGTEGSEPLKHQGTFTVKTVKLDTFGHVVGEDSTEFTLPAESAISVTKSAGTDKTLVAGESFSVVTAVDKGTGSHEVVRTLTKFTLPADKNTTYTLAQGTEDGSLKLVSSDGSEVHGNVVVKGWSDLAKKSDLSAVFKFKGTVESESKLPSSATVGDVYHVTNTGSEYVYTEDGWEELGVTVSLDGYATNADVTNQLKSYMQLVTGATADRIAVLNASGQVVAGAKSIDELISQLTYTHPAHTAYASGLYKITVDDQGHVTDATAVSIADINALGTVAAATKATQDGNGNNIATTYATKDELTAAKLVWQSI